MSESPKTRPSLLLQIRNPEDQIAWESFVNIYTPLVFGYCRNKGLQEADAGDVTQDVMRSIANAIGSFEYNPAKGSFRSWLFKVTRSKLINWFQKNGRHPVSAADTGEWASFPDEPSESETERWETDYRRRLFQWATDQVRGEFNDSTWSAFEGTAIHARPGKEIANMLNISVGAVYIAKSRVLNRVRELIQTIDDEEPWASEVTP